MKKTTILKKTRDGRYHVLIRGQRRGNKGVEVAITLPGVSKTAIRAALRGLSHDDMPYNSRRAEIRKALRSAGLTRPCGQPPQDDPLAESIMLMAPIGTNKEIDAVLKEGQSRSAWIRAQIRSGLKRAMRKR